MVLITIVMVIFILMFLSSVLYLLTGIGKRFYHDILEWHMPDNNVEKFDGCSRGSVCKYCGKEIMQDSQGNWF